MAMAKQGVIFLTGVGRSGTTVLQSMLHSHSQISFSVETHFVKRYVVPFLLSGKKPNPEEIQKDRFIHRLSPQKQSELLESKYSNLEDLRGAFLKMLKPEDRNSVPFLGDKDTEHVRYFSHIKKFFPDAFMIHIIRDPRDVVASRLKTEWGAKRSLEFHIAEYQYYLKKVRREGERLFGEKFYELKYEDLLEDPQLILTDVLEELGLTFEPEMLDFYKNVNELVSEDEKKWKGNVDKPLNKSNKGKWRDSLDDSDAAILQHGLEDFFEEMGYDMVSAKIQMIQKLKVQAIKQLFVGKTLKERLS